MSVNDFFERYEYKLDPKGRDEWRVLVEDSDGKYRGDCEDASLSVLYYAICQESWLKFWWLLLTGKAKLCYVTTKNDVGHAVLRYGDMYIDNWTMKWTSREMMEALGHKFHAWRFLPTTVAIRMLKAKLER